MKFSTIFAALTALAPAELALGAVLGKRVAIAEVCTTLINTPKCGEQAMYCVRKLREDRMLKVGNGAEPTTELVKQCVEQRLAPATQSPTNKRNVRNEPSQNNSTEAVYWAEVRPYDRK